MDKQKVLFVCMGNICRSPAAEGVFRKRVDEAGLSDRVEIDSAGLESYHIGESPDPRMREAAARRGYLLEGRGRQVQPEDFHRFDWILTMDERNFREMSRLKPQGSCRARLQRFTEFCMEHAEREVPDPYYGGPEGFEVVLDLLEDGCRELLERLQS